MSPVRRHLPLLLALLAASAASAALPVPPAAHFDGAGRFRLLTLDGRPVPVGGELRVAGPGWRFYGASNPWSATGVTFAVTNGESVWTGRIPLDHGGSVRYEQRVKPLPDGAEIALTVRAENDFATEGFHYFLQLPVRPFAEAQVVFKRGTNEAGRVETPPSFQSDRDPRFLVAPAADAVLIDAPAEKFRLSATLEAPRPLYLQDDRAWDNPSYSLVIPLSAGRFVRAGDTARLRLVVRLSGEPDREPVSIALSERPGAPAFEGFGGNFVYGLEGPMATNLIERLRPVRARIEMPLYEWEPENDNASPEVTDEAKLAARDAPGSTLRARFELARVLAGKGLPLAISVWDLPEWMYEGPPRGRWASRRTVAPAMWPEVLESAGAYLLYLKKQYGVEPELFSFNEPETGVRVLFTSEQHREMIIRFGDHFNRLGLKTKILLGDVAEPRGTESYGVYALSDPACGRRIGAAAFHSWGGAAASEYAAWPSMARRFGLPLDVTELGWDASSWRTPHDLDTAHYVIHEARMILDVLAQATPRSALLWEYTDDYPLLKPGPDGRLEDTVRLAVLEQLVRLTPVPAMPMRAASARADVATAAFRGREKGFVLHLANYGATRPCTVEGVPAGIGELKASIRSAIDGSAEARRVPVKDGKAGLDLPAWSLVTLGE